MAATAECPTELAEIGVLSCLYRSDTGALTLLNASARDVFEELRHGRQRSVPVDGRDVPALAGAWRAQGFLDAPEESLEADVLALLRPAGEAGGFALDRCYTLDGRRVCRVTASHPVLSQLLEAVLEPLAGESTDPLSWIDVLDGDGGRFHLVVDGIERMTGDLALIRSEVLRHVVLALAGWDRVGALLHATTVAADGGGVALIGASGSGKSTLGAELVARHYRYVADDLSALDRELNAIHPFPLGLSVKSGSLERVGRHFPELSGLAPLTTRRLEVRYLDLSEHAVSRLAPVPLAALVFPVYAPAQPLEVERLTPEAALQLAISTGSLPDGLPRSIHPLARLCNEIPAWHLAYGDVSEAADWIIARATQDR